MASDFSPGEHTSPQGEKQDVTSTSETPVPPQVTRSPSGRAPACFLTQRSRWWLWNLSGMDPMTRPVRASSFLTPHCDGNTDFCSRVCRTWFLHCADACRGFLISCPGTSAPLPAFGHYDPRFDGLLRMYEILFSLPDCVQAFFPLPLHSFLHSCLLLGRNLFLTFVTWCQEPETPGPQPSCWEGAASLRATGEH